MWDKVTLGMFQALDDIRNSPNFESEIERDINILACYTGKPIHHYEVMHLTDLRRELHKIRFLSEDMPVSKPSKYLKANGRTYKVVYDFRELRAGQYIDAMSFGKDRGAMVQEMHNILASICLPVRKSLVKGRNRPQIYGSIPHNIVAEDMRAVNFQEAYGVALFFYQLWTEFYQSTQGCFPQLLMKAMNLSLEQMQRLEAVSMIGGDGYRTQHV
ncbi:hypothetical protein KTO58_01215 [Chitinophaga pendula]|uniref:hypothetical protein n=1 Tax=Chitinophaga TaxID=79328 RepID=UPI000BAED02E|nr:MULTISPECIES: hypothetical protein [Chitinophaga]ASZ14518.1 hypothetical protein CK934_28005 [Chitinophaga sp. MD30]UCJ07825.1 hypothetical protein KTO58_01215 [Chitinophaga pendula]